METGTRVKKKMKSSKRISRSNSIIVVSEREKAFREAKRTDINDLIKDQLLKCTSCGEDVSPSILRGDVCLLHSRLGVLICEKCRDFYKDGYFSTDEDGDAKWCRWCGQGGTLFLCELCDSGFCQSCLERNVSREEFEVVRDSYAWYCYHCNPQPLYELRNVARVASEECKRVRRTKLNVERSLNEKDPERNEIRDKSPVEVRSIPTKPDIEGGLSKDIQRLRKKHLQLFIINMETIFSSYRKLVSSFQGELLKEGLDSLSEIERLEMALKHMVGKFIFEILKAVEFFFEDFEKCVFEQSFWNKLTELVNYHRMEEADENNEKENGSENESEREAPSNTERRGSENGSNQGDESDASESPRTPYKRRTRILDSNDNSECMSDGEVIGGEKGKETDKEKEEEEDGEETPTLLQNEDVVVGEAKDEDLGFALRNLISEFDDSCATLKTESDSEDGEHLEEWKVDDDDDDDDEKEEEEKEKDNSPSIALHLNEREFMKTNFEMDNDEEDLDDRGKNNSVSDCESRCSVKIEIDDTDPFHFDDGCNELEKSGTGARKVALKGKVDLEAAGNHDVNENNISCGAKMKEERETIKEETTDMNCDVTTEIDSLTDFDSDSQPPRKKKKKEEEEEEEKKKEVDKNKDKDKEDSEMRRLTNLNSLERKRKHLSSDKENDGNKSTNSDKENSAKKNRYEKSDILDDPDDEDDRNSDENFYEFDKICALLARPKCILEDDLYTSSDTSACQEAEENKMKSEKEDKASEESENKNDKSLNRSKRKKIPTWRRDSLLIQNLSSSESDASDKDSKNGTKRRKCKKASRESIDCEVIPSHSSSPSPCTVSDSDLVAEEIDLSSDSDTQLVTEVVNNDVIHSNPMFSPASQESIRKGRRNIRRVIEDEETAETTRKALREEVERKKRVFDRNSQMGSYFDNLSSTNKKLVLDYDKETKSELISVDQQLVAMMKPHQIDGVKFMWDTCFESVEAIKNSKGCGCILAHCMGLGKTFQVVSLVHTLLAHKELTKVHKVLIICPKGTVQNWNKEFQKWLSNLKFSIDIHHLFGSRDNSGKASRLETWHENGGVMLIGYELFRSLTTEKNSSLEDKHFSTFWKTLVNPGADVVICDEGHKIKNNNAALSKQIHNIRTLRRIVLTGTPLQNNLIEYHCMVNFIKPNFLGTKKEFINRFENPIKNGQYADSTEKDVNFMKRRAHVLHNMLDGFTQRRDVRELMPYLPQKQEYVISIRLTDIQIKLMRLFLETEAGRTNRSLIKDWQYMARICSHPLALPLSKLGKNNEHEKVEKQDGKLTDASKEIVPRSFPFSSTHAAPSASTQNKYDKEGEKSKDPQSKSKTACGEEILKPEDIDDATVSSKFVLLFAFLKQFEALNEKVLVFSQNLYTLDLIEHFLKKIDEANENASTGHRRTWKKGLDYMRLDGSTSTQKRLKWISHFNKESNIARLFLISTGAGGLGINLTSASRVIIFDVSWNPSKDIQSLFRVYRFGQHKPCYVYRFVAQGTMEEKVYDRQITKLSLASRVVDERQVHRYHSQDALQELYTFTPAEPDDMPINIVPKDRVMAELLHEHRNLIFKVFMHDSLLNHLEDEELDKEEQRAAWDEFEKEKHELKPNISLNRIQTSSVKQLPPSQIELMKKMLAEKFPNLPRKDLDDVIEMQLKKWKQYQYSLNASRMKSTQAPGPSISRASGRPNVQVPTTSGSQGPRTSSKTSR